MVNLNVSRFAAVLLLCVSADKRCSFSVLRRQCVILGFFLITFADSVQEKEEQGVEEEEDEEVLLPSAYIL